MPKRIPHRIKAYFKDLQVGGHNLEKVPCFGGLGGGGGGGKGSIFPKKSIGKKTFRTKHFYLPQEHYNCFRSTFSELAQ